ncbi:MAG: peroxidase-related enzyme [Rhizobiaceae bacterium]
MSVVHDFTTDVLTWNPYVEPVDLDAATQSQRAAMGVTAATRSVSVYTRVLAHDAQTLQSRTPLFNAIMYGKEGLSRGDRELGAIGASIYNGCVYCTSVHARFYQQFGAVPDIIETIFAAGTEAKLPEREQAIFDFSVKLSHTPPSATPDDVRRLKSVGLSEAEIVDLVRAAALFGWANRLMHTLGEPQRG